MIEISDFMPHGYCFAWNAKMLWLHLGSDILTGISYYAIAGFLIYLVFIRRDIPFSWVFILFGMFIFACGSTHFMSAWTVYVPSFWTQGWIKAMNAIFSLATAILLFPLRSKIVALPTMKKTLDENLQLNKTLHLKVTDLQDEIGKRKQAEEALRESEAQQRLLLESTAEAIYGLDPDGKCTFANKACVEMLGYDSAADLLGRNMHDLIHHTKADGKHNPVEECKISQAFFKGTGTHVDDEVLWRRDATSFSAEYWSYPIRRNGEIVGSVVTFLDITERRRLEKEGVKAQKLESLGVLAGGIAHDFNNLLTSIIGNLSLIELAVAKDDNLHKRLLATEKATMQASELTKQLLTFSKGGHPIKEVVSLGELLYETACFALRGSNVKCSCCDMPDDLWAIDADQGQISQVINNLTINAKQAMPDGGELQVCAENYVATSSDKLPLSEGRYVKVTFADKGVGISKEVLQKIFDPYFTTKKDGSGLGLASSYSIVTKHGGHIDVSSEVGVGTTFTIYLPASEKVSVIKKVTAEDIAALAGSRILVMDDEEIIRDVAGEMLVTLGYEVRTAAEGNEAVRLYKEAMEAGNPFDLVIMDITIPGGLGGKEAIKKLLEIDPGAKAIISSGYSNDPIMSNFKEYGFRGIIAKPYNVSILGAIIRRVLTAKEE